MARLNRVFLAPALGLLLLCLAGGCAPSRPHGGQAPAGELPRANPGYIQWLERQSLLRKAPEFTAIVSGSSLPWNAPSTVADLAPLLDKADIWLDFNPRRAALADDAPALAQLARNGLPRLLADMGVHGLFLSAAADAGTAWDAEGAFAEQGRDAVSYAFAPAVGSDEDYAALEDAADAAGVVLGGELLPAATGLGPDFFLAVRGVRDYPGLFLMAEVPQECWDLLPLSRQNDDSAGRPLPPRAVAELARRGVVPPAFSCDLPSAPAGVNERGGWAATSEIVGVDGVNRRWVYRYAGSPRRAVLNWDDPSGAARRVLAAGVIRQVGLLHQPLVSLSVAALWGQDPAVPAIPAVPAVPADPSALADPGQNSSPEPALSALRDLCRDARRYGSRSLLRDPLPAALLPRVQAAGVDFAADTVTSPALEYALLSGDTAPLKQAVDASLAAGVDHARLWRAPADGTPLPFAQTGLSARLAAAGLSPDWQDVLGVRDGGLAATAPALAAAAAGLTPEQALRAGWRAAGNVKEDANEDARLIQAAHLLQIAFRAMQPGLLFLSGQDLSGALFAPEGPADEPLPEAWTPEAVPPVATRQGLPVARQLYPPLAAQPGLEGSFAQELARLAQVRRATGVAGGRLIARADLAEPAAAGVLTLLPDGELLLAAGNFSGQSFVTDVNFPAGLVRHGGPCTDLITGRSVAVDRDHLRLRMEPWQYRIVRLGAAASKPADAAPHS